MIKMKMTGSFAKNVGGRKGVRYGLLGIGFFLLALNSLPGELAYLGERFLATLRIFLPHLFMSNITCPAMCYYQKLYTCS